MEKVTLARLTPLLTSEKDDESDRLLVPAFPTFLERESNDRSGFG